MIISEHCISKKIMRNYRREFACRPPMCHECEDAVKAAGSRIGEGSDQQVLFELFLVHYLLDVMQVNY
jgi:hypothetical protein